MTDHHLGEGKLYEGTKQLRAWPMNKAAYCGYRGWSLPTDEDPLEEGRLVEYLDGGKANHERHEGYISWSPADVFDKAYRPCETHVDRMRIEHSQLSERITKAVGFISGNTAPGVFAMMGTDDQMLLIAQVDAMRAYSGVLALRLRRAMLEDAKLKPAEPYRAQDGSAEPALTVSNGGGQTFTHDRPPVHVDIAGGSTKEETIG